MERKLPKASQLVSSKMKGQEARPLPVRKAFLIAALVFVLNYVLGTAVVLQLNLSDPGIGGSARDTWLASGTQLGAPAWFMVSLCDLAGACDTSAMDWHPWYRGCHTAYLDVGSFVDSRLGMVLRVIEHHLTVLTGLAVAVLVVTTPTVVILGIATLIEQGRARMRVAIP